ncbi:dihydropteroate synthase [Streptomyces sp. B1866]|uniref:dihydropteroate synthase n=1 Tax=Streptomyces sp. B1866 TaxID=3075431 RepID=UPI00288F2410|nr:dihydropteroate synthase [Streptomyces sp. B1866]MDT3397753.1 dihydropteroate synthase [Streptomyces sp. B1866]
MSRLRGRGRVAGLPVWDRCAVMGVVNVTPDSFSDGGQWFDTELAVKHGLDLVEAGADLVDVGGESTRPGAARVDEAEERRRVVPVVRALAAAGVLVSVDTMRASVAEPALDAGAVMVNDVSGGRADPAMVPVVAAARVPFVVMHWRGQSIDMNNRAVYGDVVAEVVAELRASVDRAVAGGVDPERIVVDPGLGFAKNARHDLALVARLGALAELGRPLLVAASRKRFLGRVLAGEGGSPPPARERDAATAAVTAIAAREGAWAVRVHEVRASADAVRVARAIEGAAGPEAWTSPDPDTSRDPDTGVSTAGGPDPDTSRGPGSGRRAQAAGAGGAQDAAGAV